MAYEWRKGDLEWERPKVLPPTIHKDIVKLMLKKNW